MNKDIIYEQNIEARKMLVFSARQAKSNGFSAEIWKTNLEVIKYKNNFLLGKDILDHIAAFIWTFGR